MEIIEGINTKKIKIWIADGKIGVLPTDTIYGLHASAFDKNAIEKIYEVEGRNKNKPFIILISSLDDLAKFELKISEEIGSLLSKYWPGKISIVIPCNSEKFSYLHRGKNSLAFRLPDYPNLKKVLEETGPMVSTSVNPEGEPPAHTIDEAINYFGDKLDFYVDVGRLDSEPSTVVELRDDKLYVIRQGAVKIDE